LIKLDLTKQDLYPQGNKPAKGLVHINLPFASSGSLGFAIRPIFSRTALSLQLRTGIDSCYLHSMLHDIRIPKSIAPQWGFKSIVETLNHADSAGA
jgi:hypothetical protein